MALFAAWMVPARLKSSVWRTGFTLAFAGFVVETLGLGVRVWLSGRPPVTNLYSSAVFVGWAMVGFSLILEFLLAKIRKERNGIVLLAGAAAGASTLLIAQGLAESGDTLAVLAAVLDTNFWLATHVVTIAVGYAAAFLAGFLGIAWLSLSFFAKKDGARALRSLGALVYGVTCFALFFSFVGTVLGGIWADQSWGRFWGFDPKENGAMMIVLWTAAVLHARLCGWAKDRGLSVLAVLGNIVTAWSWFGVNQLGKGLHSYGFTDSAALALWLFVLANLAVAAAGVFARPRSRRTDRARSR